MLTVIQNDKLPQLILNIDDFGADLIADQRILSLLRSGIANSVSFFATSRHFDDVVMALKPFSNKIDIGVHLDLTHGQPIGKYCFSSFQRDPSMDEVATLNLISQIDANKLEIEFELQLQRALDSGLAITHIDNHRSEIYFCPDLFARVLKLGTKYNLYVRNPFDKNFPSKIGPIAHHFGTDLNIATQNYEQIRQHLSYFKCRSSEYFAVLEFRHYQPGDFMRWILSLPVDGLVEIVCHAGHIRPKYALEYDLFLNSEVRDFLRTHAVVCRRE